MGHPMRLELTLAGLLVKLANHYTIRGIRKRRGARWIGSINLIAYRAVVFVLPRSGFEL